MHRIERGGTALVAMLLGVCVSAEPLAAQAEVAAARTPDRVAAEVEIPLAAREHLGKRGAERRIPSQLRHRDRTLVESIAKRLRAGLPYEAVEADWVRLVRESDPEHVEELTRWVLREAYLEQLELRQAWLESARARAEQDSGDRLAKLDLQKAQQAQQQTLQMIANMQKAKHDAAMSSIRNMK